MAASASLKSRSKAVVCLGRAYAGAILFSFPILMTMEMWALGVSLDGFRIALLTAMSIPLLVGLSYHDGFEITSSLREDIFDTFVAYAVGFSSSAVMLFLFNVINFQMSFDGVVGRIALQAVPAAIGATMARSLLQDEDGEPDEKNDPRESATYIGQIFLMTAGAIFLSMSVAPTEEMVLLGFKMTAWHTLGLLALSLLLMQCFFYAVESRGNANALAARDAAQWSIFLRFTVVGYAIVLLISYYVLWTFGSLDGMGWIEQVESVIVLAVPASVGASASRLIL